MYVPQVMLNILIDLTFTLLYTNYARLTTCICSRYCCYACILTHFCFIPQSDGHKSARSSDQQENCSAKWLPDSHQPRRHGSGAQQLL